MTRGHALATVFTLAASALTLLAACGGQFAGTGDGGTGSGSGGSNGGGQSSVFTGASVTCTPSMGGGSSGGDAGCSATSVGTCDDGEGFNVSCRCPAGTCTCSKQTSSSGTETKTISTDCPEACEIDSASLVTACEFTTGGSGTPADAGLPACTIPSEMQPPSQPGAWSVGRALLNCTSAGLGTECLSSDGTTCPNDPATVGATCTDECAPDQYAVEFGGPPTSNGTTWLSPPAISGCTGGGGFPSGTETECCPCQ